MRLFILLCLLSSQVSAQTSIWKVSNGKNELWLGGTVHVLSPTDYPLPPEFKQVYDKSEVLVLETDVSAMMLLQTQQQLLNRLTYADERSLKTVLTPKTYNLLNAYLQTVGVQLEVVQKLKPGMIVMTLTMLELQRLGMDAEGVDLFFNNQAVADNKNTMYLETLATQIELLETMGAGQEDALIIKMLSDLKALPTLIQPLKQAWRTGDIKQLEILGINPMRDMQPELYETMLVQRNKDWIPKIKNLLRTPITEFVLVGVLHLVGEHGLLAQLRQQGYTVTPNNIKTIRTN